MKKLLQKLLPLTAITLYCLFLAFHSGNLFDQRTITAMPDETKTCALDVPSTLFYYVIQNEAVSGIYCYSTRTTPKKSFNQFTACPLAAGKLLFYKYIPYVYYPQRIIVWFKSTDIIFPFHTFW